MTDTPLSENKILTNDSSSTFAKAYSPSIPSPKQPNQADSIEQILSTSIQRAKQKITMLEGRQREERAQNKERASSREGHNNAVAAAMKVLQSRVTELQQSIQTHERERKIMLQELDNLSSQKKFILSNFEESNRKITMLENTQRSNKAQIKELAKQLQQSQGCKGELQSKCESLEMTIRHLQSDKQQLNASIARREQESAGKSSQQAKMSSRSEHEERMLAEREKKFSEKERRLMQYEAALKEKESKWAHERVQFSEVKKQNQNLRRQVKNLKKSLHEESNKEIQQNQNYEVYLNQIKELQGQISMLRQTTKHFQTQPAQQHGQEEVQALRQELNELQIKYQELIRLFKRAEDKAKREEKDSKLYKDRIRELEDLLSELIQKIGKLPNSTKELKYLAVKASKVMNSSIQRVTTLKTPTKSRSNSLNRSLSRSSSVRKNTQTSQLNNSRTSNKAPQSGSKSKRKNSTSATKQKRVLVSQTGQDEPQKQLNELKKQYKKLVKKVNETDDESIRNRLNEIAFLIQQKNESVTKMRQQNKYK